MIIESLNSYLEAIRTLWVTEDVHPFPREDIKAIEADFEVEFKGHKPQANFIGPDLSLYWSYIAGLASGGIRSRLADELEREKMKESLQLNFFATFPQYRFLESYDLETYESFNRDYAMYERLRIMLLSAIEMYESK